MRLGEFISANIERILADWEAFARTLEPGTEMAQLALRNDAESILRAAVRDMRSDQSLAEQASKSKGHGGAGGEASNAIDQASSRHGIARAGSGFNLVQVVSEYRALRASVLRLWRASIPAPDVNDIDEITRFNECIDQSLAEAVASYAHRIDQVRHLFMAVLAHDLRNPLSTISLSAIAASLGSSIAPDKKQALSQIETSVKAISRLINDLTDFASAGLGIAMPLSLAPMNLEQLGEEVVREIQAAHPTRQIVFQANGDGKIVGDAARLRQVLSNLLGNAIQHGSADGAITLTIAPNGSDNSGVVLIVRNGGRPIPADLLPTIFDPLVRGNVRDRSQGSIGLGLYIVREIVLAHGGSVEVTSSASEGTEFHVRLPLGGRAG
jgi:signal transduction histidine kinase